MGSEYGVEKVVMRIAGWLRGALTWNRPTASAVGVGQAIVRFALDRSTQPTNSNYCIKKSRGLRTNGCCGNASWPPVACGGGGVLPEPKNPWPPRELNRPWPLNKPKPPIREDDDEQLLQPLLATTGAGV